MELTREHREYIKRSVLCWLATASASGVPNVSPKEIFRDYGKDSILVANIASPQTVRNIRENNRVCISFIDILVQKGFQVKGTAEILGGDHPEFASLHGVLSEMSGGKFPFTTLTRIKALQVKPIVAPRYVLFPETTEAQQIASAKRAYGI